MNPEIQYDAYSLVIPSKNILWSEANNFQQIPTRTHLVNGEIAPLLLYIRFKQPIADYSALIQRIKIINNSVIESHSKSELVEMGHRFAVNPSSSNIRLLSDLKCIPINSIEDNACNMFIVSDKEIIYQVNFPILVPQKSETKIYIKLTANLIIEACNRDLSDITYASIKHKIQQNKTTLYQEFFTVGISCMVHDCFKWLSTTAVDTLKNEVIISVRFEHPFFLETIKETEITINEIEFVIPESTIHHKRDAEKENSMYKLKHFMCFETKIYNSTPEKLYYGDEYSIVISIKPLILPNAKNKYVKFLCDSCKATRN